MKLIGVIAEFNPFHNGHAYLIEEARRKVTEETGEETCVIICMSGNYVQRGSLAVFDKYTRAESSLCFADIVFEMPVIWATSDAGRFAACGVNMLSQLNCDYIAFGIEENPTEHGSVSAELQKTADILFDEPEEYKSLLSQYLSDGQAYPLARINAFKDFTGSDGKYLSTSNNILALEYLISIKKYNLALKPVFIPRKGADYGSSEMAGNYSSATAIREYMNITKCASESGSIEDTALISLLSDNMPAQALSSIDKYLHSPSVSDSDILPYIIGKIRTSDPEELQTIYGMNEELCNRLMKLNYPTDYDSLKDYMKTRNLTMTRVCRLLLHTALGIKEPPVQFAPTKYANLLAMRKSASKILEEISNSSDLTVINKKSAYKAEDSLSRDSWQIDCRTTDIYDQIIYDKTGITLPTELRSNIRFQ